jgi:hypothetical protein
MICERGYHQLRVTRRPKCLLRLAWVCLFPSQERFEHRSWVVRALRLAAARRAASSGDTLGQLGARPLPHDCDHLSSTRSGSPSGPDILYAAAKLLRTSEISACNGACACDSRGKHATGLGLQKSQRCESCRPIVAYLLPLSVGARSARGPGAVTSTR